MGAARIYRAGVIGRTAGGGYGHNLHMGLVQSGRAKVVAVADVDREGREKVARETDAPSTYGDFQEMLDAEELDLVTVGPRWVDCHEEMVLACIGAGCHVYCEKPMAASLEVGDRLVAAADAAGVKIAVAHQAVYLPQVRAIKKMLDDGCIGPVQSIYARGKQDRRGGGEDMMVLGTHLFNLMRFFVGDVDWMSGHVRANGQEIGPKDVREAGEPIGLIAGDCIESYFSFCSGVSGFFTSRANQPGSGKSYGMEIVGQDGRLVLRDGAPTAVGLYPHGLWAPENTSQQWEVVDLEMVPLGDGNRRAVLDLMDAIEEDRDPLSSGRDAVAALEMILGVYESQIRGSRVCMPMVDRTHPLERFQNTHG